MLEDNADIWIRVNEDGYWKPSNCLAVQRVAIVIPYRDRENHLTVCINRLVPVLKRQQAHFKIFVVEQVVKTIAMVVNQRLISGCEHSH